MIIEAYLVGYSSDIYHNNFGLYRTLEEAVEKRAELQAAQEDKRKLSSKLVIEEFLMEI